MLFYDQIKYNMVPVTIDDILIKSISFTWNKRNETHNFYALLITVIINTLNFTSEKSCVLSATDTIILVKLE